MKKKIAVLPGDGIGPEVMAEAIRVLEVVGEKFGHVFEFKEGLVGGAAYDKYKNHFPEETKTLCETSDAILFGSVGGPVQDQHLEKWKGCEVNSILAMRKTFMFYANLRPAKVYPELKNISPLRAEIVGGGVDVLIVRELVGDIYFGEHQRMAKGGKRVARDVAEYSEDQVVNIARVAFKAALTRRKLVTSVDKANVLETSRLWREVVTEVGQEYANVELVHMLVDNCAMQLISNPAQFDVILTTNMFGDILSDAAAVLPGSLGLTPSASLTSGTFGLYEPSGGSAPDIAGKGIANPIAQILSAAMMLRYSFAMEQEAKAVEAAVSKTLSEGSRTKDICGGDGNSAIGTKEFGDRVLSALVSG